jgi:hypothetical protein
LKYFFRLSKRLNKKSRHDPNFLPRKEEIREGKNNLEEKEDGSSSRVGKNCH